MSIQRAAEAAYRGYCEFLAERGLLPAAGAKSWADQPEIVRQAWIAGQEKAASLAPD